ncbi:MAG: hypothetical protein IJ730_01425 [Alphaproteobacteria bacterium]|nr:hypothetical protein [Alphaproteobacteria bacterium]
MKRNKKIDSSLYNKRKYFYSSIIKRINKYNLLLLVLAGVFVLFCGIDDKEAIDLYIKKLQLLSVHKIKDKQISQLSIFYLTNNNKHPLQKERQKVRSEFSSQKRKLKQEWEAKYKISWPKTIMKIKREKNKIIVIKEHTYEAHHVIPINAGGINQWWNISPLSSKNHKLLHESIEEKACFSHDFVHQRIMRFILKVENVFSQTFGKYINKKGTNYAKEPFRHLQISH